MTTPGFEQFSAIFLTCSLSLVCAAQSESREREDLFAFVGVSVVPMDSERIIADQTVIIRRGNIRAIGPSASTPIPEGATQIDGKGKYLMPGLADMHVHPDHPDQLLLFVANGVTTVRNMHGAPKYLEWKKRIAEEGSLAPFIYTTGPLIDGKPGRGIPGGVLVDTPEEARKAVIDQKTAGYDYIKVLGGLSLEAYDAVMAEAATLGLRVVGHVPPAVGIDHAVRAGQHSIEHMDGIAAATQKEDSPLKDSAERMAYYEAWKHIDVEKVRRIGETLAAKGTWVCPTLVSMQSDPMPDEIERFLERPEIRFVWPDTIEWWKASAVPAELVKTFRDGIQGRKRAVKALHDAGVRLVLGTDSPAGFVLHGFGTLRELEILVEAGLTPYEALRTATQNAADLVGASDEFGTVAVGKRADLLLLEADPLEDVSNVATTSGVMLRGRWFSKAELQAKLDALAKRYAKMKAEGEATIAIENVNIIPMDREAVLADQTVLVRDGKFVSIAPASEAHVPAFATRIDGTGKYLMPGLADMHVHLAHDEEADPDALVVFLAAGVTTVRNMWGQPVHLDWRKRINDGDLLGPNIYSTGPITDGDPPFWKGSTVVRTPDEAAEEVAAQKRAGYDGMKVFTNLSPELYNAILVAAKGHDFPVYGHVPTRVGLTRALSSGQKSFEHMTDFMYALLPDDSPVRAQLVDMWGDRSKRNWRGMFLDPYGQADRSRIPDLAAKTAAAGVWICPTLAVLRNFAADAAEFEQFRSDPMMRYVPPQKRSGWERTARFLSTDEGNDPAIMKHGFETMLIAVKALHDAGARLIVGTDTPNPFVIPGFSVHKELEHFIDAGLTPYEAIKAATRDAADFVDALDEWGTITTGRRADLILVDANPLDDVGNASKQTGVMIRGRWYPKATLQTKLDALAEKYEKMKAEGEVTADSGAAPTTTQESLTDGARMHFAIDHVAWILDQRTLDAIAESPLLQNEFANSRGMKTQDGGGWARFYLYGSRTQYLEFVSQVRSRSLKVAPGDGMVAFNAEEEGSVDWIIARMSEKHPESAPSKSLKTFVRGEEEIPQSHVAMFNYKTGHEGFGAWVLEIHREFKNRASGGRAEVGDITRARVGASVCHHPDKYFKDVVSVTAAVSEARRRNLANLLTVLGYGIAQSGATTVCTGEENVIELIPKTNQKYAITRIRVSLMRPKEGKKVYRFGPDIVLTFSDGLHAVWEFGGTR